MNLSILTARCSYVPLPFPKQLSKVTLKSMLPPHPIGIIVCVCEDFISFLIVHPL